MEFSSRQIIAGSAVLILVTAACAISFDSGGEPSEAEQTLQAIYAQDTAEQRYPVASPANREAERARSRGGVCPFRRASETVAKLIAGTASIASAAFRGLTPADGENNAPTAGSGTTKSATRATHTPSGRSCR